MGRAKERIGNLHMWLVARRITTQAHRLGRRDLRLGETCPPTLLGPRAVTQDAEAQTHTQAAEQNHRADLSQFVRHLAGQR